MSTNRMAVELALAHLYFLALFVMSQYPPSPATNYYVSPNKLTWTDAEKYCNQQCHSNLASIHNEIDQKQSIQMANTLSVDTSAGTNDIWIGLYFNSRWHYTDGTSFDYHPHTNNYSKISADLSSQPFRIQMDAANDYEWISKNKSFSTLQSRFMCNQCDSVLNKYVVINEPKTFADANLFCLNALNTTLASIHSDADNATAWRLCKYGSIRNCWIGMIETEEVSNYSIHNAVCY